MESITATLVLEYLKVFLSAPVLAATTAIVVVTLFRAEMRALIGRIAHVKLGAVGEFFTSQQVRSDAEATANAKTPEFARPDIALPPGVNLSSADAERVAQSLRSAHQAAALWEYRYLNFYLARATQAVLTWLAGRPPVLVLHLDAELQQHVVQSAERRAIVEALQKHHLIEIDVNGLIQVTPKGREYLQWRGPLPPPPQLPPSSDGAPH